MNGSERIESLLGRVMRGGMMASAVCLGTGLLLSLMHSNGPIAPVLLHLGIVVLMATPVAGVVVSIWEFAVERDRTFVLLATIVLLELAASAVAALVFNQRL